jgi:hypothetical protein
MSGEGAAALSDLCFRSKAVKARRMIFSSGSRDRNQWANCRRPCAREFMALMPAVLDHVIGVQVRNLNNGQPSLHAALIAAAAPQHQFSGKSARRYSRVGDPARKKFRAASLDPEHGSNSMASSPPALRPAWCTAMTRESCSNPSTSSMSMPARRGQRMHGSTG